MAALQAIYLIEEGADFGYLLNEEVTNIQTQTDIAVVFVIDAGGVVISEGLRGCLYIPFDGTIISANILADVSGDIVVDIWKDVLANYPPADDDSICAAAPLTIVGATYATGTITTWDKTITAGDVLSFNIDSIATITNVTITLVVRKS
jgi:hypothetical protein